jgi:hypothetical protein
MGCNMAFKVDHGYDFCHACEAKAVLVILNMATCRCGHVVEWFSAVKYDRKALEQTR